VSQTPSSLAASLLPGSSAAMAAVCSALRRLYLSVYNWVIFYGWCGAPACCWIVSRIGSCACVVASSAGSRFDLRLLGSWGCCRAQVLYYTVMALRESGHEAVYAAVERPLQFAQTAAIMEV
jgi:very-long-chain (3R)-3-hydroxyacyl-CoA dehydratase